MRSFISKAAVAALILSSTLGMAAASPSTSGGENNNGSGPAIMRDEQIPAPPVVTMAQPSIGQQGMKHTSWSGPEMRPHLTRVSHEINRLEHRIDVDRHHGYLTKAEARDVMRDAQAIRQHAVRTAARHDGALPRMAFVRYQDQVSRLGQVVHRLSTNA